MSRVRGAVIGPDDMEAGWGSGPARTGWAEQPPLVVGRGPKQLSQLRLLWPPVLLLISLRRQRAGMGCQAGCLGMPRARRGPLVQLGWVCTHLRQHQASVKSSGPLLCVTRGAVGWARGGEPRGGARGAVRPGRTARRGPGRQRGAARALWGWPLSTGFIWREAEHRRLSCSVRCCGWAGCARAAMLLWRAGDVWTATLRRVPRAEHHCGAWVTGLSRGPFAGKRQAGSRRGNKDAASRSAKLSFAAGLRRPSIAMGTALTL